MTELQMGLIGLGALAIVSVLAYNKWQEVRQRKSLEQKLKANHPDVLFDEAAHQAPSLPVDMAMAAEEKQEAQASFAEYPRKTDSSVERIEPVLVFDTDTNELPSESGIAADPQFMATDPEDRDPMISSFPSSGATSADPALIPDYSHLLSPQIDFIASIDTVDPVSASEVCNAQREILACVHKPIHWIGYSEKAACWEIISGQEPWQGEYRYLRVGLQLANRQGPASDDDLAAFSTAMQDLADQFTGIVDLPSRQAAFVAAGKLDEFCVSVDIQIGINVISRGQVFPGTKLRTLAEVAGMTLDETEKRFVRRDEEGNILFVLLNQNPEGFSAETIKTMATNGVTFLLDVPCVARGERVLNQMVDLASHFAEVLHGELVDDNRRPLSESSLGPIRQQIVQFQSRLTTQHLSPGSALTRRLFS